MPYRRVVNRNHLHGDYGTNARGEHIDFGKQPLIPAAVERTLQAIRGDLRRLERDALDPDAYILGWISAETGFSIATIQKVLASFFEVP
jgi:hypothetical protein